jgi:flavin reductase (DIM6/NTAB) family NADH-FMN oxidoreductase RutF
MKKRFNKEAIMTMEKQARVHFINSLGGFKSICLVGSTSREGQTNLAIFSSILHIGANPPMIAIVFRPSPPERNTLTNIMNTGFYSLNHINETIYKQAHQTSARYDQNVSEFDATGLQVEFKNDFLAPFVKESHVQMGIQFKEKIEIKTNQTVLIIGEIVEVYIPNTALCDDGFIDLEKAETITCSGLDSYHKTTKLGRLSYAKTNQELISITSNYIED